MADSIWSLSQIEDLLSHDEASVQHWAADKLFKLYPEEAHSRLQELLSLSRPAVAGRALDSLGEIARDDLIPVLGHIYMNADAEISARAIMRLGDWRAPGGVDLIKERILQRKLLARDQIVGMIYALGKIPGEDAYDLLKHTERSIQEKETGHWQMFYTALLRHRHSEDVATLLRLFMDESLGEERRREALGILLGSLDLGLNPSDVFFANHASLEKYWLDLIRLLEGAESGGDWTELLGSIEELLSGVNVDDLAQSFSFLGKLGDMAQGLPEFLLSVYREAVGALEKPSGSKEWDYGILSAAVAALLAGIEGRVFSLPPADADWRDEARYLLRNRPEREEDKAILERAIQKAQPGELIPMLITVLQDDPGSWGALRAVEMLGRLRALEAAPAILQAFSKQKDDFFSEATREALVRMGVGVVPYLLPWLDRTESADREKLLALDTVADLTTQEGVDALLKHFQSLFKTEGSYFVDAVQETGARDFLELLESEYRPGEVAIGRAFVHISRVNGLEPPRLREIASDVKHIEALMEDHSQMLSGGQGRWPKSVLLELACKVCSRAYTYEVSDLHVHPRSSREEDKDQSAAVDMTPFRHGVVIGDELRCKNCGALNRFDLTPHTFMQLTTESLKLVAMARSGIEMPSYYPVKHVQLDERDGKPLTLEDAEIEHLNAVDLASGKPGPHLALAKFYEYVKEYEQAKKEYLAALDLDARALEAMAGLARLAHAEGELVKATEWISDCYEHLDDGHLYLVKEASEFKKTVREKRKEFARESGVKVEDQPVKIRFKIDTPDYPKNKPCPCGSGKKYKMCCMNKEM